MFFITTLAPGKPVVKLSAIALPEMGWPEVRGVSGKLHRWGHESATRNAF